MEDRIMRQKTYSKIKDSINTHIFSKMYEKSIFHELSKARVDQTRNLTINSKLTLRFPLFIELNNEIDHKMLKNEEEGIKRKKRNFK